MFRIFLLALFLHIAFCGQLHRQRTYLRRHIHKYIDERNYLRGYHRKLYDTDKHFIIVPYDPPCKYQSDCD